MQLKTAGFMATTTLALGLAFTTAAQAHDRHHHHDFNRGWNHHQRIMPQRIIPQYGYAYPPVRPLYIPPVINPYPYVDPNYSGRSGYYGTVPCYPVIGTDNLVITICPR